MEWISMSAYKSPLEVELEKLADRHDTWSAVAVSTDNTQWEVEQPIKKQAVDGALVVFISDWELKDSLMPIVVTKIGVDEFAVFQWAGDRTHDETDETLYTWKVVETENSWSEAIRTADLQYDIATRQARQSSE
jgi:hypothetical protein